MTFYALILNLIIVFSSFSVFSQTSFSHDFRNPTSEIRHEKILSFNSMIEIQPNSNLMITETIIVIATGENIRHGITRDFPTKYLDKYNRMLDIEFNLLQTKMDGQLTPSHLKQLRNGVRIYIGRPDQYLSPGIHSFVIRYQVNHELGYFTDYDELYWNVTGNGWVFPIDKARAKIFLPKGAPVLKYSAYTGFMHAKDQNYVVTVAADKNSIEFVTTKPLQAMEGLTIAVAWPKGFVHKPNMKDQIIGLLKNDFNFLWISILSLGLMGYFLIVWFLFGKEPPEGIIVPLYAPPTGFSPAAVRFLYKFGVDQKALVAALINLAVKNKLKIVETDSNYTINKMTADNSNLTVDENYLFDKLFKDEQQYVIPKQTVAFELTKSARDLSEKGLMALEAILRKTQKNAFKLNRFFYFIGLMITILITYFLIRDNTEFMSLYMMVFVAIVAFLLFKNFWPMWRAGSYLSVGTRIYKFIKNFFFPMVILLFFLIVSFMMGPLLDLSIMLVLIIINIVFYHLLKVYTPEGQLIMDKIRGLKMYLNTTEKYRLLNWQPPDKTPEVYERLLPYAIALDAENNWSEQFKDVLANLHADNHIFTWYRGPVSQFNGLDFSNSIGNNFATAMYISSATSPPGSFSGSGGGGSSGGGGGGGGGGGW